MIDKMILFIANSTSAGSCSDGELRLGNMTDDYDQWSRRGRVELCINNAWGTVCGTSFSVPDALVTCNQLVGFQSEGQYIYLAVIRNKILYCACMSFDC